MLEGFTQLDVDANISTELQRFDSEKRLESERWREKRDSSVFMFSYNKEIPPTIKRLDTYTN